MKKKNIINKLIVAPLVMGFMSCTGNYMDINSNPYQPGDLTPDDYALGSAMSNLASTVISSDANTAQFTDCLLDRWEVILPIQMPAGPIQYPILMLQMTGRVCS